MHTIYSYELHLGLFYVYLRSVHQLPFNQLLGYLTVCTGMWEKYNLQYNVVALWWCMLVISFQKLFRKLWLSLWFYENYHKQCYWNNVYFSENVPCGTKKYGYCWSNLMCSRGYTSLLGKCWFWKHFVAHLHFHHHYNGEPLFVFNTQNFQRQICHSRNTLLIASFIY